MSSVTIGNDYVDAVIRIAERRGADDAEQVRSAAAHRMLATSSARSIAGFGRGHLLESSAA